MCPIEPENQKKARALAALASSPLTLPASAEYLRSVPTNGTRGVPRVRIGALMLAERGARGRPPRNYSMSIEYLIRQQQTPVIVAAVVARHVLVSFLFASDATVPY